MSELDEAYEKRKSEASEAFIKDLRELMKKHHVQAILAEDHWQGYAECGEDIRMTAELYQKGDDSLYVDINLGRGFWAEE